MKLCGSEMKFSQSSDKIDPKLDLEFDTIQFQLFGMDFIHR